MRAITTGRIVFGLFLLTLILSNAIDAEAQRGGHMPGFQQGQEIDEAWGFYDSGYGGYGMMGPGMMGPGAGMFHPYLLTDLTDEQRQQLRNIQREMRRAHMEDMLDLMDARDDLMEALAAERPDPEEISKLHQIISQKQGQMLESSVKMRNRMHDQLTQEQQEQLREMRRQGSWGRHSGPRGIR